jgi:hypothetical protein
MMISLFWLYHFTTVLDDAPWDSVISAYTLEVSPLNRIGINPHCEPLGQRSPVFKSRQLAWVQA